MPLHFCLLSPSCHPTGANLTVQLYGGNIVFEGPVNKAEVIIANIKAGNSVIHVVDDVLVPPGIVSAETAKMWMAKENKMKTEKRSYMKTLTKP